MLGSSAAPFTAESFKGWLKSTWENSDEFDIIEGLNLTRSLKDRVVITPPVPDVEPEDPALYWRRGKNPFLAHMVKSDG